jgi:phosphohistidine phosphatase
VLLILMRHGEAGEADSRRWPDDRRRPLTDAGRREHARVAEALRRMDVRFDRMLSSPLLRARETAEITARIYGASPPELSELLGDEAAPGSTLAAWPGSRPPRCSAWVTSRPSPAWPGS